MAVAPLPSAPLSPHIPTFRGLSATLCRRPARPRPRCVRFPRSTVFLRIVDDDNRKHALSQQVDRIIRELLEVTKTAIGRDVTDEAEAWWTTHYRAKFYHAIDFKGCSYDRDATALKRQARRLGEAALGMAGQRLIITREHAALASFVTDCPPPPEGDTSAMGAWCN